MPKKQEKPDGAATVRTYEDFTETLGSFAAKVNDPNGFKFLLILGKGGKGKTELVDMALQGYGYKKDNPDGGYGYARAKLTGINLYKYLYTFRDMPIVLDDVNAMLRDPSAPSIIQAATETRLPRTVSYRSNHSDIGYCEGQTPPTFETSSPIIIIANEWHSSNEVIKSIETRAMTQYFNPNNEQVHSVYVPTWFGKTDDEKEVYDYIGSQLEYVPSINCRSYVHGKSLKYNHPDSWQRRLDDMLLPEERRLEILVLRLLADESYATDVERIEEFYSLSGHKTYGAAEIYFKRIKLKQGKSRKNRPTEGEDGRRTRHLEQ